MPSNHWLQTHLDDLVLHWGFPPGTHIYLEVVTPDELPDAYAAVRWTNQATHQYHLLLRCDALPYAAWLLRHELLEILLGDYATLLETTLTADQLADPVFDTWHRLIRDRCINHLLAVFAPTLRPPPPPTYATSSPPCETLPAV